MPFPTSDLYKQAIRNGAPVTYTIDATLGGVPVAGATGLRPTGGNITDTTKPGVRRVLNLQLAPAPGLFNALAPVGTTLVPTAHIQFTDRSVTDIPMGVFDVDSQTLSEGGGGLSLTAPDKWVRLQRRKFTGPQQSNSAGGISVVEQIVTLMRDALGAGEPVNVFATSTAKVSALTWTGDRTAAINALAASIGAWCYFDRYGVFTVANQPTIGASPDWLIDASPSGVLTSLDRTRSRTSTYNVVAVESSAASGPAFPMQLVWDSDPSSPTFAGPNDGTSNPITRPDLAGPFGVSVYNFDTPLPLTVAGAQQAGRTILARTTGLASSVSLGSLPNPAVDAFDVLDVLPPAPRVTTVELRVVDSAGALFPSDSLYPGGGLFPSGGRSVPVLSRNTTGAVLERHVVDTVTHPLTLGSEQQIDGRSTRTDDYS